MPPELPPAALGCLLSRLSCVRGAAVCSYRMTLRRIANGNSPICNGPSIRSSPTNSRHILGPRGLGPDLVFIADSLPLAKLVV
jgi:hypothetical protein